VAVLVTRPEPENAATAEALRARGFDALLAPLLQFQTLPFRFEGSATYGGVIVTSASALRAVRGHVLCEQLKDAPVFSVGARTADAARSVGFANVTSADGDVAALARLVAGHVGRRTRHPPLLYLAGADTSADITSELARSRIAVTTLTVYRMAAVDSLPQEIVSAFAAHRIEAVLHYSGRSASSFVVAIRAAGLEVGGLAVPQVCMSASVAQLLREAGAPRAIVAERPEEGAMIEALERTLRPARA